MKKFLEKILSKKNNVTAIESSVMLTSGFKPSRIVPLANDTTQQSNNLVSSKKTRRKKLATEPKRIYLKENLYYEKDIIKSLGGEWDYINKRWYCYEGDEEKFEQWLPGHIRKFTLPKPSKEQEAIIAVAKLGDNILVDAVAGSGKTTTLQMIFNELSTKKRTIYLTFNRLLKEEAKVKLEDSKDITNYNSFAKSWLSSIGLDTRLEDQIDEFNRHFDEFDFPKYDLLLVDEYQDVSEKHLKMLKLIKSKFPDIQIICVGDVKQQIYDKGVDIKEEIKAYLDKYTLLKLSESYRLSPRLCEIINPMWGTSIIGKNKSQVVKVVSFNEAIKVANETSCKDLLVVGAKDSTSIINAFQNHLEQINPEKFNKTSIYSSIRERDGYSKVLPDSAIFTTYDSCKGLEKDTCIVCDWTEKYWCTRKNMPNVKYDILRNIFMVAITRGYHNVLLVKLNNQTILSKKIITKSFEPSSIYQKPFNPSTMFDFKYDSDIDDCYNLLNISTLQKPSFEIKALTQDANIDLSPCVGILAESIAFKNYDFDRTFKHQLLFASSKNKEKYLNYKKTAKTNLDKIYLITTMSTGQDRYFKVCSATKLISLDQQKKLCSRLSEEFNVDESNIQNECALKIELKDQTLMIRGQSDVIKNSKVYELKFVSILRKIHYLQCAVYIILHDLDEGVLWNLKTNEKFSIKISDKQKFINSVIKCITKGAYTDGKFEKK